MVRPSAVPVQAAQPVLSAGAGASASQWSWSASAGSHDRNATDSRSAAAHRAGASQVRRSEWTNAPCSQRVCAKRTRWPSTKSCVVSTPSVTRRPRAGPTGSRRRNLARPDRSRIRGRGYQARRAAANEPQHERRAQGLGASARSLPPATGAPMPGRVAHGAMVLRAWTTRVAFILSEMRYTGILRTHAG